MRQSQRQAQSKLDRLAAMEDELEQPRQDLEQKRREERGRRAKITTLTRELQVRDNPSVPLALCLVLLASSIPEGCMF